MTNILVAGAGKTSYYLIQYLLKHARAQKWQITVIDASLEAIKSKIDNHPLAIAAAIDVNDDQARQPFVEKADFVVSLLPPHLHIKLAQDCILFKKNIVTSSYRDEAVIALHPKAKEAGITMLYEMGADPGVDHMSATQLFQSISKVAGVIKYYHSYCGGIVHPEHNANKWHYKVTWNPRNVVKAGANGARILRNGELVTVDYTKLFDTQKTITLPTGEVLAYYPNRDSLKYREAYNLLEVETLERSTLRHPNYILGWNAVIKLGLTNDTPINKEQVKTFEDWLNDVMQNTDQKDIWSLISTKLNAKKNDLVIELLRELDLNAYELIPEDAQTNADLLQNRIEKAWKMQPSDKDWLVMVNEVIFEHKGKTNHLRSVLSIQGESSEKSAMAKCVGLPMAIYTHYFLTGKIQMPKGLQIPTDPRLFKPIFKALEREGIHFIEEIL